MTAVFEVSARVTAAFVVWDCCLRVMTAGLCAWSSPPLGEEQQACLAWEPNRPRADGVWHQGQEGPHDMNAVLWHCCVLRCLFGWSRQPMPRTMPPWACGDQAWEWQPLVHVCMYVYM